MTNEQKDDIARFTRGNYVLSTYRWLIEVAFLFAAFTEFPAHKWSIGLGVLAFNGSVAAIGRAVVGSRIDAVVREDGEARKTRHAIVLAGEQAGAGQTSTDQEAFWATVAQRVAGEYEAINEYADKPMGFWAGTAMAVGAFIWQLIGGLFGIGLVAALTSGT